VINAGRLDRRVKLQRLTESQSESGAVEYTPRLIATVWAEKVPEGGSEAFREAFREEQLQGWSRVTWRIRWVQDDFDLSEPTVKWRLVEGTGLGARDARPRGGSADMITAEWSGLKQAIRNAQALGEDIGREEVLEKGLVTVGRPLRDDIVRGAPRSPDAPHVADTFIVKVSKEEREAGQSTVLVGPKAGKGSVGFVAAFLEFGTSKMAPRPFIRPPWDGWRGSYPKLLTEQIRRHYNRVVRKYTRRAGYRA
jgi:HK97 gp10 family phage protein